MNSKILQSWTKLLLQLLWFSNKSTLPRSLSCTYQFFLLFLHLHSKSKGRKSGLDIVSSLGCLVVPSSIFYYKYIIKVSSCARHPWKSLRKASERGTILGGVNVVFIRGSNKVPATPRLLSLSAWSKFQIDVFWVFPFFITELDYSAVIKVTDLRQDEVTKEANTVHIVSMNVTGGEVRVVELDSVKSSAIKRQQIT